MRGLAVLPKALGKKNLADYEVQCGLRPWAAVVEADQVASCGGAGIAKEGLAVLRAVRLDGARV